MIEGPEDFAPSARLCGVVKAIGVFGFWFGFAMLCAWLYSTSPGSLRCDATASPVVCAR